MLDGKEDPSLLHRRAYECHRHVVSRNGHGLRETATVSNPFQVATSSRIFPAAEIITTRSGGNS